MSMHLTDIDLITLAKNYSRQDIYIQTTYKCDKLSNKNRDRRESSNLRQKNQHLVRFIVNLISNCSFILKTSDGQCSRLRRLKNGVPQGSTLAPMLFNIYIRDIADTVSTQYGYADDLAILFSHKCWSKVEEVLSLDMQRIAEYLSAWRLRLSAAKTTCTAFHLKNRESSRKLAVTVNGTTICYTQNPKYLTHG